MYPPGLPPDPRAYHPHITLARTGRTTGPPDLFLQRWAALTSEAFTADAMHLYESSLGSEGASYTIVATYPLSRIEQAAEPASSASQ